MELSTEASFTARPRCSRPRPSSSQLCWVVACWRTVWSAGAGAASAVCFIAAATRQAANSAVKRTAEAVRSGSLRRSAEALPLGGLSVSAVTLSWRDRAPARCEAKRSRASASVVTEARLSACVRRIPGKSGAPEVTRCAPARPGSIGHMKTNEASTTQIQETLFAMGNNRRILSGPIGVYSGVSEPKSQWGGESGRGGRAALCARAPRTQDLFVPCKGGWCAGDPLLFRLQRLITRAIADHPGHP